MWTGACCTVCYVGAESRTEKETEHIMNAVHWDIVLLRMCKETIAELMRCVLSGSLSTHCVAFAGQLLAHTPLPHADLQTIVLVFITCVSIVCARTVAMVPRCCHKRVYLVLSF